MTAALRALSIAAVLLAAVLAQARPNIATPEGTRRDLRPSVNPYVHINTETESVEGDFTSEFSDDVVSGLAAGLAAATPHALAAAAASNSGLGPVLCNTLDCPSYKVLERYDGIELRRYDPATFSSTVLSLDEVGSIEKAAVIGFHRLLKYNLGDNEDSKKVAMTAPVLYGLDVDRKASSRRDIRLEDRFSVSFFVPFKYQDQPPSPSNPDVFLVDVKEADVYVRSFDGYATGARIQRIASSFLRDLYDDGHRVDCRTAYIAQYSPPFQPVFRYNEVWFLRRRRRSASDPGPDMSAATGADDVTAEEESCDFLLATDGDAGGEKSKEGDPEEGRKQVQIPGTQQPTATDNALKDEVIETIAAMVSEARRDGAFVNPVAMES